MDGKVPHGAAFRGDHFGDAAEPVLLSLGGTVIWIDNTLLSERWNTISDNRLFTNCEENDRQKKDEDAGICRRSP